MLKLHFTYESPDGILRTLSSIAYAIFIANIR